MCDQEPKNFKLHYFGGRGRAEFIRYILAAGKVDFDDHRITHDEWPELKKSMPTGQLPVLEFECCGKTVMLPQSVAIAEFAAKIAGLYPECKVAAARSMAAVLTAMDFHEGWKPWYMAKMGGKEDEAAAESKKIVEEKLPHFAGRVEKRLADGGKPYLGGDKLTWTDLVIADVVDRVRTMHECGAKALDDYPKLKAHCEAVHQLPGLKEYVEKRPATKL